MTGVDREQEMARMIGGAEVSAAVIASAREMLDRRRAGVTAFPEVEPAPPKRAQITDARADGRKRK
jgi:hypothetical protein